MDHDCSISTSDKKSHVLEAKARGSFVFCRIDFDCDNLDMCLLRVQGTALGLGASAISMASTQAIGRMDDKDGTSWVESDKLGYLRATFCAPAFDFPIFLLFRWSGGGWCLPLL